MDRVHNDRGVMAETDEVRDGRLICELLQNWVVWRDAGDWEWFRTVWLEGKPL